MDKLKLLWGTGNYDYSPEFISCGLSCDHIQFAYRNVRGAGATTRYGAVINWVKQVAVEWNKR